MSATVGLLVPLVSQPSKSDDVHQFLLAGYGLVPDEPLTSEWFAVKYASSETYAIFDTFAAEEGRKAHLTGKIAAALMENAPKLLSPAPEIGQINILASKVQQAGSGGRGAGNTAGLGVGLRVLFTAKPGKVNAVRDFLIGAKPLVEAEPNTPVWYAFEYPGTGQFGIVDFFASETGRDEHLAGKVAAALFASVDELLVGTPDVVKVDVVAAKI